MATVRIALSQFRPTKGEYQDNVARIGAVVAQAARLDPKPDLVVFPETATSGYFVEGGVKELAVTAGTLARDLAAAYDGPPIDVAVGFYERFQNHIYNSALYVTLQKRKPDVRHVHRKVFLPTYGVFDEERFVDRGQDGVRSFETAWGGKAAILICEDAWHSLAATVAALEGAQLIIVPSASPARGLDEEQACDGEAALPESVVRWERIVRGIAEEHGVFVALANLVGFEGGKGFPGASAVIDPTGRVIARGPLFEEALLTADIDLDSLTTARSDSPLLADLQSALPVLTKGLKAGEGRGEKATPVKFDPAPNGTSPLSHRPHDPTPIVAPAGQYDGARAHDRALRPLRQTQGPAPRHEQQVGAAARLLHLARRRRAAGQSARRPLQNAGLGSGAARRGTGTDRGETGHGGPDQGTDRRRRPRRLLRTRRPHSVSPDQG